MILKLISTPIWSLVYHFLLLKCAWIILIFKGVLTSLFLAFATCSQNHHLCFNQYIIIFINTLEILICKIFQTDHWKSCLFIYHQTLDSKTLDLIIFQFSHRIYCHIYLYKFNRFCCKIFWSFFVFEFVLNFIAIFIVVK